MWGGGWGSAPDWVALRKESVDRNTKTVALEDPESDFKNTLQYEYYNSMRK